MKKFSFYIAATLCVLFAAWLFASPMVPSGGSGQTLSNYFTIPLGQYPGATSVNVFGQNPDGDAGTETLWNHGGLYVFPTQSRIHNIVSTDEDDDGTPGDTGARTVLIEGLDANCDVISETKTLEGLTPVATSNSYLRINRFLVVTAGATESNEGTITATAAVDGTVSAEISPGTGQSSQLIYTVPNGKTLVLSSLFWTYIEGQETGEIEFFLKIKPGGTNTAWRTIAQVNVDGTASSWATYTFTAPLVLEQKTDFKVDCVFSSQNMHAAGAADFFLLDNGS